MTADRFMIVETDNHGSDYPDERFLNLPQFITQSAAEDVCRKINDCFCPGDAAPRYWKVVKLPYQLQPGFEP